MWISEDKYTCPFYKKGDYEIFFLVNALITRTRIDSNDEGEAFYHSPWLRCINTYDIFYSKRFKGIEKYFIYN